MKLELNKIYQGDAIEVLKTFPDESVDCIVTSPPYYGLRDYGVDGQIGLEKSLNEFLNKMLEVTAECKRVLKKSGTMWWNHGDSYNGLKVGNTETNKNPNVVTNSFRKEKQEMQEKCLLLQAHRLAIRMIDEQNWILRNIIIWHKPNVMPSSVKDRFTVDYEPIFFFTKSKKYWFEPQFEPMNPLSMDRYNYNFSGNKEGDGKLSEQMPEGQLTPSPLGRNKRTVWKIATQPFSEAHFATFPEDLIVTPIKAGCPEMICKKCGKARESLFEGTSADAFNIRVRDVKEGRPKFGDRVATDYEVENYNEGETHVGEGKKKLGYTDCGCNAGWNKGIVLDPFFGSGTTGKVAQELGRNYIGIELNPEYIKIAEKRLSQKVLAF